MDPTLRAARDRIMYDTGALLHIVHTLPEEDAEARCAATGWTMRETLGYLGDYLRAFTTGDAPTQDANGLAGRHRERSWDALATLIEEGAVAAIATISQTSAESPTIPASSRDTLARAAHVNAHGLDFLEVVPGFRRDPVLVEWALRPGFPEDAAWLRRAQAVIEAIQRQAKADHRRRLAGRSG